MNCRWPGCVRGPLYRELCNRHYRQLAHRVHRGQTTWADLELARICGPRQPGHGNRRALKLG